MTRELAIRASALYTPIALAALLWWWREPDRKRATAALLACAWVAPSLLVLHRIAIAAGWWRFTVVEGTLSGMPVDLYLGWIALWGLIPVLAAPGAPAFLVAVIAAALDAIVMPLCAPVLVLTPRWLAGEALSIALVLVPALCLARWTLGGVHLARRAAMQAIAFSALMLLVVPSIAFEYTRGTWQALAAAPAWRLDAGLQLLAMPAILGLGAVQEFVTRGRGTPVPFDPPARLVATGPYRFVGNPMQLSMALVMLCWGWLLASWWIAAGSVVAVAYSAGLAAWHEDEQLIERFGSDWTRYRRGVPRWIPRWRPFIPASRPSRLYVDAGCGLCRSVGEWFTRRGARGIEVVPADTFPTRDLLRMTYVAAEDGYEEDGVAAFARALEHVNAAWAWLGMLIRLPLVRPALQFLVDASGGRPERIERRVHCATSFHDRPTP